MPLIETVCRECGAAMQTPYMLIGAGTRCASCGSFVVPKAKGVMSDTGRQITFGSFVQLLTYDGFREHALPLVALWFPEVQELVRAGQQIEPGSAEESALLRIHREIQADPDRQGKLYNRSMDLRR